MAYMEKPTLLKLFQLLQIKDSGPVIHSNKEGSKGDWQAE
jgi:hypothetical protein